MSPPVTNEYHITVFIFLHGKFCIQNKQYLAFVSSFCYDFSDYVNQVNKRNFQC